MKTLLKLLLLCVFSIGHASAQVITEDGELHTSLTIPMLTPEQFAERMTTVRTWPAPPWWIHAADDQTLQANFLRDNDKTNDQRRGWERKAKQFRAWIDPRIAAGSKGSKDKKPTITMSPLEYVALYLEPTSIWDDALGKWAKHSGPALAAKTHLRAVGYRVKRMKEPSAEDLAFAEKIERVLQALEAHQKGKPKTSDLETLKAFVAEMK